LTREMNVHEAIEIRRSYRAIEPIEVSDDLIEDLAYHASLAPSCYNNQPWRFVFVRSREKLERIYNALSPGNGWARNSSLIIAVYSKRGYDCLIGDREYYLFDTGIAVGFMILRAVELGLIAHVIAGYNPEAIKKELNLPEDVNLIALIIVGRHSEKLIEELPPAQREREEKRPPRKSLNEIAKIM